MSSTPDDAQAAQWVAQELAAGKTWSTVARALVESGWERDDAKNFVQGIQSQGSGAAPPAAASQAMHANPIREEAGGDGLPSWVLYIGGLGLINGLSWLFDWPFWIY